MKVLLVAALAAFAIPAFAASDFDQAPQTPAAQEAVNEGLIPADQLDASEYQADLQADLQTEALPPRDRRPGHRPDRPGHRPGRPMPPHRERWQCVARDRFRRSFRGDGWNLNEARREAMRDCERGSVVGRCRLVGCGRTRH